MDNYELMLILKPSLPENVRNGVQDRIEKIIKKDDGEVLNIDVWGKKYLAYAIKKHTEGYFILFQLKITSDQVKRVSEEIKVISDVIRYGIFKVDKFVKESIKKDSEILNVSVGEDDMTSLEDLYSAKI